uniref:NADH-ubiquinone oxidoreductase chain 5 n=1 Tax=Phrynocephalus guinanensis TaxID=740940 RepID=A0A0U1V5T5_9SAUR|nr:NADH dehydrogenase subunit 5 [Phrynocephalus guinanensis]AIM52432.1 NADH dehydrogenase subunit 5 [Phrynocephalus guinanensis]
MLESMMISLILTSMLLLALPIISKKYEAKITKVIKTSFLLSLFPTMLAMKYQTQNINIDLYTINTGMTNMTMTLMINKYSTLFLPTALFVTWSIMEFSTWYMTNEPTKKFQKHLLIFLISMLTLATAGSFMQLLTGWEGVGILSFMLINWWSTRTNANAAALQAIIYNRIGDIGLILVMVALLSTLGTWDIMSTLTLNTKDTLITLGLIMAAIGKSAQFFMHMWLPAAMEGPTPVSSLLHSSTMVVAGIYMLAQMHPMMSTKCLTTICLGLGTLTSIYSALCAIAQNDIKKIIAFSTSSQLGLMMIAIGINKPDLAMFHMITHATFKSTLFLCSGSIIHNMQNEQDIRKMNCTKNTLPTTTTMMTINGMALAGTPFLSGFYSKDMIIETMMNTNINAWALMATLLSTTMTSIYTMRMIFYMTKKFFCYKPVITQQESNPQQTLPLIRLTLAAMTIGTMLMPTMLNTTNLLTTYMKMTPTMTIVAGTYMTTEMTMKLQNTTTSWKFISHLAFFKLLHRTLPLKMLKFSQKHSTQLTDLMWLENMGPTTIDLLNTTASNIISTQKGQIKKYLTVLLIATTILLLMQLTLTL